MEEQLEAIISAKNARRSQKLKANKVLQKGEVLYLANARHMNRERLELEKARKEERERAWQIRYDNACKKVFRITKVHLKTWQSPRKWEVCIWKEVIKELMDNVYVYVEE